jgi:hypothetical protein
MARREDDMKRLLALTLLFAGDTFADGVAAYRAGRYDAAQLAFAAAARAADGDRAGLFHYDEALAALQAGALDAAEAAARAAATNGGDELRGSCDFLLGSVAFERARAAAVEAHAPGASSQTFDRAIALCDAARQAWQRAALSRVDWPAARRNVERALARLADLERERAQAQQREQEGGEGAGRPPPQPVAVPQPAPTTTKPAAVAPEHELAPEEVEHLFEKLDEQERKKRLLREASRRATAPAVERDW